MVHLYTLFQLVAVMVMGFLYVGFFFIISVFEISGNSWNLINSKVTIDNYEKQNCVNNTVAV
jgi:hypothetical protein